MKDLLIFCIPFLYGAAIGVGGVLAGLPPISPPTISGALVVVGLTTGALLGRYIFGG